MTDILGGTVLDPESGKTGAFDLRIADGVIQEIAAAGTLPEAQTDVIDASGKIVTAGLVDIHVHFRDPGFTHKEDILTGAEAAKRGGYTSVVMMGNTKPHPDNLETLRYMLEKGGQTGIHVYPCANVTMGMEGKQLTEMEALAAAGAVLFTDDGLPVTDEDIMREACKRAAALGKMISLHEEDHAYVKESGVNAGPVAQELGLTGASREAEYRMVERDIAIARETGCALDVQHVSCKESVALIRAARAEGLPVHAEATPHHFSLTEDAVRRYGTLAKVNPPIRTEEDRLAIIEGLKDGTIEMIATDHAPHAEEEKALPFVQAPSGMTGLENALSLGLRELVKPGHLSLLQLLRCMSTNPARIAGLPGGCVKEGAPADLLIFDPEAERTADRGVSRSSNTPFTGQAMPGVIQTVICKGKTVYGLV
ncbi:MAG: dihydroorotase [Lachnospiraceae bacterium]|nr:dihydroorotase [Lachnospiraceae bacterium]